MFFSLIIPTCNRPNHLKKCLTAAFLSDCASEHFEVIVVIDGNDEKYRQLIDHCELKYKNLRFFNQTPRKGPAAARNLGCKKARGRIIGFTDDDCMIAKDWIRKMIELHLQNPDIAAVGGETLVTGSCLNQMVSQYFANSAIQFDIDGSRETVFFPTCNVSLKKKVLTQFAFDESFPLAAGEDLEYFWRLYKRGLRFLYDDSITIIHHHSPLLKSFIKQQYNYGKGNLLVFKNHKDHPALKYLSLDFIQLLKISLHNLFNIYDHIYWQRTKRKIIEKYKINPSTKRFQLSSCILLHKISYLLGNLRQSISLKFNF